MSDGRCEGCQHWEWIDQHADDYEYLHEFEVGHCGARRGPQVVGVKTIEIRAPVTPSYETCRYFEAKSADE